MSTGNRLWLGVMMILMLVGCGAPASNATPTPLPDQSPSLNVSPLTGAPGAPVAVAGTGWQPGATVLIYVQDPSATSSTPANQVAIQVATTTVEANGRFVTAFALPAAAPWRNLSRVYIRADVPASGDSTSVEFAIVPSGGTAVAGATPTLAPSITATTSPDTPTSAPTSIGCVDRAEFVGDISIPDQSILAPGAAFIKTWRLRNVGTCTWDTTYALVFARGDNLGGPSAAALAGNVTPGGTLDVSVGLSAPAVNGVYRSFWQLRSRMGNLFGIGSDGLQPFWVNIVVGPTPTPVVILNWRGEYFANRDLAGAPVLVRDDVDINFNWGTAGPAAQLPTDSFSARWTRAQTFEAATYRFHVLADDGVRFYIDSVLLIDDWRDGSARRAALDVRLTAGSHVVRMEYYERGGQAVVQLGWEKIGETFPEWEGQYWANRNLAGDPIVTRNDTALKFDWGTGSPASNLPADEFSARWTRTVNFAPGRYRFTARADDGVRVFIDGALIINEWHFNDSRAAVQADVTLGGAQRIVVEYFEAGGGALFSLNWARLSDNPSPTFTPTKTPTPSRTPTATASVILPAGMVLQGRVTLKDEPQRGLANVPIYRSFASYPGVIVAVTDQDGRYQAPFQPIPGDETVTVWAQLGGVTFEPAQYNWRHSFGYKVYQLDFKASAVVPPPPVTPTFTRTPTPTATSTSTTEPPSLTPTASATASPTATSTSTTESPSLTPTASVTASLTPTTEAPPTEAPPTVTFTPTATSLPPTEPPTATATLAPAKSQVIINEVLPVPVSVDWNKDGEVNARDQWIEIANLSQSTLDISSWSIDNGGKGDYSFPIGTVLQPQQIVVFYGSQTGLNLSDETDQVRLKDPRSRVVDRVKYERLPNDASTSRDLAGNWHNDWPPSPGAPNAQPGNAIAAQAKARPLGTPEAAVRGLLDNIFAVVWQMVLALFQ